MGILKWIVFVLGGLAFLITAVFAVMLLTTEVPEKTVPKKQSASSTKNTKGSSKTKNNKNAQFIQEIEYLKAEISKRDDQIDSLTQISIKAANWEKEIEKLQSQLTEKLDTNARAKEMAKTLSTMKARAMGPILNKLDDASVILIYQQTSKTSRKDILLALDEDRAAKITKKLINQ